MLTDKEKKFVEENARELGGTMGNMRLRRELGRSVSGHTDSVISAYVKRVLLDREHRKSESPRGSSPRWESLVQEIMRRVQEGERTDAATLSEFHASNGTVDKCRAVARDRLGLSW
jgi:hypothetical protein